jgi:hypothetical protein
MEYINRPMMPLPQAWKKLNNLLADDLAWRDDHS